MSHCIGDTHRDDKTNICMHEHVMTQCRSGWRSLVLSCSWFKPAKTIHPLVHYNGAMYETKMLMMLNNNGFRMDSHDILIRWLNAHL